MRSLNVLSAAAAAAVVLVASPVLADQTKPGEWRQIAYTCDTGQDLTIAYRESGSAVEVTATDRPAVKLVARPAKAGFRFGDSRHELRGDGEAVTWQIDNKTPLKCTSQDPAALNLGAAAAR
ncbi:MAG: MliC family protein [Gammaproteobacteria bacterium]